MSANGYQNATSPFTVMVGVTRKPGSTFEEFKAYYENHHVPLVMRIMAGQQCIQSYTRHYVDRNVEGTFPLGKEDVLGFDAIARSEYKDKKAYEEMLQLFKNHFQEIDEDEKQFLDQSKTVVFIPGEGPAMVAV